MTTCSGFFRIYSFPWTPDRNAEFLPLTEAQAAAKTGGRLPGFKQFPDDTPEHKAANQAQGEEILRVVLEASGETTVVAEDLGVVPEYVPPTLQKLGIPGFRIPTLFREPDGRYSDPKKYPRLSLAQPATHDHPPLAAAWAECWQNIDAGKDVETNRRELRLMMEFAGLKNSEPPREFTDQLHEAFTRTVLQSPSWLAVFQITDVFGMTARFNTPGSVAADQLVLSPAAHGQGAGRGPGAAAEDGDVLAPRARKRARGLSRLEERQQHRELLGRLDRVRQVRRHVEEIAGLQVVRFARQRKLALARQDLH